MKTIASSKGTVTNKLVCPNKSIVMDTDKIKKRDEIFQKFWEQQEEKLQKLEKKPIKITLPDGKVLEGKTYETTPFSIAKSISNQLAKKVCVAKITYSNRYSDFFGNAVDCDEEEEDENEESKSILIDLNNYLEGDCKIELLDFESPEGQQTFWHSSAHILGRALEQYAGGFLTHGPPLTDGFFYDSFIGEKTLKPEDYNKLEQKANELVSKKVNFQKVLLTKDQALELFGDNPFKVELIKAKIKDDQMTTAYRCGDLVDLCTGPHLDNTSKIKAFKVQRNSAAYWLGKQDLDQLQRVYAVSFPQAKQLKLHLKKLKELEELDHRNVGTKQKLFFFSPLAPGCTFFLPHGTRIFNRLQDLVRKEYSIRGFTEVNTPTMFKNELWKTSGHYFKYKDDMFFVECEQEMQGIKPMNCPSHCLIFNQTIRSYRELPIRYADFGVLHRNEISGALTGLTRVRKFHQDDAHIFCMFEQIQDEIQGQLEFITYLYEQLGFEFDIYLSTRPQKYLGTIEMWDSAEKSLSQALNAFEKKWKLNPGDGAFYGPKIDIRVKDCFQRSHQLGTIQLDFNLPQRFNLQYKSADVNKDNKKNEETDEQQEEVVNKTEKKEEDMTPEELLAYEEKKYSIIKKVKNGFERPIIIHRAILGSLERCMAILTEHFKGKWPFWLSPRQICIIPVSSKFEDYAKKVQQKLMLKNYFVDIDLSSLTLNKRIRNSLLDQYNIILVVGESEVNNKTVTIRERDDKSKKQTTMTLSEFYLYLQDKEVKISSLRKNIEFQSQLYSEEEREALKKVDLDINSLTELDQKLQLKSFLSGDGYKYGDEDVKMMNKLDNIILYTDSTPNLYRWKKTCEALKQQ